MKSIPDIKETPSEVSIEDYTVIHVLSSSKNWVDLEKFCRALLRKSPNAVSAWSGLGCALDGLGKSSVAAFRRAAVLLDTGDQHHVNLGNALRKEGDLYASLASYLRALDNNPNSTNGLIQAGHLYIALANFNAATDLLRRAVAIDPTSVDAHLQLGLALRGLGNDSSALASVQKALALGPNRADAFGTLGDFMRDSQNHSEAMQYYQKSMELDPNNPSLYTSLFFCLGRISTSNTSNFLDEYQRFADQFEAPFRTSWPHHKNSKVATRQIRIGIVSGDLRSHAICSFIEPLLEFLSSTPQVELYAYSNYPIEDAVTHRLKSYFAQWHAVSALTDNDLTLLIQQNDIDILVDLSGHTAYNRLLTFARKPAPIQVSWMGYPGTTGLQAMDYYFTDANFAPPGLLDDQFTEKLVRLPASAPFRPVEGAPPINALPALANGSLTLGSFNAASKISRPVVALWARLLHALSNARMVLGAMPKDGQGALIAQWFAEEGIDDKRLEFIGRRNITDYMALHHQIDICLDTFPYNGGTTTMYAIWMGVPTLTLAGNTLACRTGACIMGGLSLPDFVANSEDDFVSKGVMWAGRLQELSGLRATMRERFNASALGRPELIAAGAAHAFRTMWQRWCNGLEPESFEVTLTSAEQLGKELVQTRLQAPTSVEVTALVALFNSGAMPELEAHSRKMIERSPNAGIAWKALGVSLLKQGKDSIYALRRATHLLPQDPEMQSNLGFALHTAGNFNEAIELQRRSIIVAPKFFPAYGNLGLSLLSTQEFGEAEASFRRAIELQPAFVQGYIGLGMALRALGRGDEAVGSFRQAIAINPLFPEAHHNLLSTLLANSDAHAEEIFAASRRFADQFETPLRAAWPSHNNTKLVARQLKVGMVFVDFRNGPVADLMEPLLESLANMPQLTLYAYANQPTEDAANGQLKRYFSHWLHISGTSDDTVAKLIQENGIDILIDLSGHAANNRLLAFARKPAPVQVTWTGYPGTTGLAAMDYCIADRHYLPPSQFSEQFSEKLVQLPISAPRLAEGLEQALRTMWQRWCDGLVPVSFEVKSEDLEKLAKAIQ